MSDNVIIQGIECYKCEDCGGFCPVGKTCVCQKHYILGKGMTNDIVDFLKESNLIEGEKSEEAMSDSVKAWKYLIKKPTLNKGRILHAHKILMETRDLKYSDKGAWRDHDPIMEDYHNGRIHAVGKKYYAVPALMENWINNANDIVQNGKNEPKEFLENLIKEHHIKFEGIHPFSDGNGRMGRILMNWQRVKLNLPILVIKEAEKGDYYLWFTDN